MTSTLGLPPKAMGRNKNSVLQLIFRRCGCRKRAGDFRPGSSTASRYDVSRMPGLKTRPQKRICPKQFSSAPDEKLDCLALLTMR